MSNYEVLIPSIGRVEILRAIDSVCQQSELPSAIRIFFDRRVEMVPVKIIDELKCRVAAKKVRLYIYYGDHNGCAFARNTLVSVAKSRYLAFLDDDDYWLPGHITSSLLPFSDPSVDIVCAGYRFSSGNFCFVGKDITLVNLAFKRSRIGMSSIVAKASVMKANKFPKLRRRSDICLWMILSKAYVFSIADHESYVYQVDTENNLSSGLFNKISSLTGAIIVATFRRPK